MKSSRNLPFHTRRDAWVEVDLTAVEHNASAIRCFLPDEVALMAVLKADAYGHGILMVLPTLEASGVSMVGVASVDEALQIRRAGSEIPILVLGVTPDWAMHDAIENNISLTIFSRQHLEALKRLYEVIRIPAVVHIKVDTGMHRIGVPWEEAAGFVQDCQSSPYLTVEGVFSHLAHTSDKAFTQTQIERWETVVSSLNSRPRLLHLSNSAGLLHYPLEQMNMVRAGIALFGYSGEEWKIPLDLKPAMGLKARIVHLHDVPPGEGVSYGRTWKNTLKGPRRIATLPLGYADGVSRLLSNHIRGLCLGIQVPQVGTISMDQLMMDVTDAADAQVGDIVTLIGPGAMSLGAWADVSDTIPYELMCSLRVRLPKVAVR